MPALSRELLVVLAVVAAAIAFVQAVTVAWRKSARRRAILGRVARAGEGEVLAAGHLAARGYEILGAQVTTEYPVHVDGEVITAALRADYLVRQGGATFVVEVKTGSVAPRIKTVATRRQLLEYRVAFDVDGVLLLDADTGRLHAVTFPRLEPRAEDRATVPRAGLAWAVAAAILLATAILALSRSTP